MNPIVKSHTSFERAYTAKVNWYGFLLLAAHLPVFVSVALWQGNSLLMVFLTMALLLAGPALLILQDRSSELAGIALGIAAMGVSALAIHLANGQIEAHFEIFILLALLAVFGRTAPLVAAGTTIILHHLLFWIWLPSSVFNYQAGLRIVLIHAGFVVFDVLSASWIAIQFGRSVESQSLVLEHLGRAVEQISCATSQVSASSQSLAQGAAQQAESILQTSSAADAIKHAALRNAAASNSAADLAQRSAERAQTTTTALDSMVAAMDRIGHSSEEISRIVRVIDRIAFQTNILALNAAVEAARAGEAGLGFAVVADEVRTLAQRSAEAAKETGALIAESIHNAQLGIAQVHEVTTAVLGITSGSTELKVLVSEINEGSQQQTQRIGLAARSVGSIQTVIQNNAAAAEETAAASEQLAAQARTLREIVERLAVLSGGQHSGAEPILSAALV